MPRSTAVAALALVLTVLLGVAPALAQAPKASAPKPSALPAQAPYAPVAVTISGVPDDPNMAAFRNELTAVVKGRVFADLARLVVQRGFFWDRDFGGGFDPKKSGAENLAAAIGLEHGRGAGWNRLAGLAAEAAGGKLGARPGIVCAPARPQFNEFDFDRLMQTTKSDAFAWTYPRAAGAELRAASRPNAPVIEKLGLHLVRVLGYEAKDDDPDATRTAWARVVAPSGKVGFVAPALLLSPYAERLCYAKDVTGRWRIAGYIGGGD